ncbi:hypothetical protein TKK_0007172 [Trichogramma kaykai]|uniref:SprT-like domain-containing protein n=1 Tax=Trichogramma kaykai TaxID=54128 RepID=A0ABD2XA24_9HYME
MSRRSTRSNPGVLVGQETNPEDIYVRTRNIWNLCFPNDEFPKCFVVTLEKNMRSNYGLTNFTQRTIKISKYLHERFSPDAMDTIIAHELIHVYLWLKRDPDPSDHGGFFKKVAAEVERRTPFKNIDVDHELDRKVSQFRQQFEWQCRTCGEKKFLFTKHHPSAANIQHEEACERPDWVMIHEIVPKKKAEPERPPQLKPVGIPPSERARSRSRRGREEEATSSRAPKRPRIVAEETGKNLADVQRYRRR